MQQPIQSDQHQRQRNKLHKSADPRSHKYTDSGVGMTGPGPIQLPTHESNWNGPEEAIGGGTYVRDYAQPTWRPEPTGDHLNTAKASAQPTESDALPREDASTLPAAAIMGGMGTASSDNAAGSDPTKRTSQTSGDGAPYWGNLPSGANGAIHNTVSGHGSATDDHNEHHHLPPKSTSSERSVIAGRVANYPRGGVYNTVTGHGSQDQEAARHSQPLGAEGGNNTAGVVNLANDTMLAAPLPDIPEGEQKANYQPTLMPETAVRDDVLLAEAASQNYEHPQTSGNLETAAARAFPLAGPITASNNDRRDSTSPSRYGGAASAAGLGAGAAAAGYTAQQRGRSSPPEDNTRHSTSPHLDDRHQTAGGAVTGKRRPSQQRSPVEKSTSRDDGSPKGEKKHRILGIFHRNKDDGKEDTHHRRSDSDRAEPAREDTAAVNSPNRLRKLSKGESAMERRRSPSASKANPEEHSSYNMEKAAVGAAAGAGALGFFHHRKRNSTSERTKDITSPTLNPRSADTGGAGPTGETLHQVGEVSTPFEHPREPPMVPPEDETRPGNYNVLATCTPSGMNHGSQHATRGTTTNEPGNYNTLSSGTASGVNATRHKATQKEVTSSEPSGYNVLGSSSKPPAAADAQVRSDGIVTQELGHYNTLASGIPSGIDLGSSIARTQTGIRNTTTENTSDNEDSTEYNILPSGTVSGVKVKSKSHQHSGQATETAMPKDNYSPQPAPNTTNPRAQALKDLPAPSVTTTRHDPETTFPSGAPIPLHLRHERAHHPNASQESVPGITSYAHPDPVEQHMSPEVMPDAYTASAYPPREYQPQQPQNTQSQSQGQGYAQEQYPDQQRTAMGMSPAVMPAAYTAAAAAAPGPRQLREDHQQRQQQQHHQHQQQQQYQQGAPQDGGRFNPALAAAATSWAAAEAGKGADVGGERGLRERQGVTGGGVGKRMARCQHCGGENDIGGEVERFVREMGLGSGRSA